jgi:hypothetical protein
LNGVITESTHSEAANQSGSASFSVLLGDVFGFTQNAVILEVVVPQPA